MMKKIFLFLLLIISFVSYGQTYNPANFTVSNKSYGVAQAVPTDARSQFYDGTNFVMRDYQSTTEVNSYLNLAKYRTGHFLVYIHNGGSLSAGVWTGGTTDIYIYKDGVLDANLVPLFTNTTLSNTGSGFRIVKPISGSDYPLRSLASSNTIIWDSTSNSNSLTGKVDTSLIVTINRLSDTAASIRLAISAGGGGITTLTGDVTASGTGSVAATIANNAVSNAKFRQSAALSVVGRTSNSTGNVADIAAATSGHVLRRNGTTLDFGTIDSVSVPLLHSENYYNTKYPTIGSDSVYVKAATNTGTSIFFIQGDTLKLKRLQAGTNVTLTSNADSSITIAASGGGGTPAGLTTELQYRNGSSFGAMSGTTWDNTNKKLTLDKGSSDSSLLNFDGTYSGYKKWVTIRPPIKNDSTTEFNIWSGINPNDDTKRTNHVFILGSNYDGAKSTIPRMWDAWESNWYDGGVRAVERHYELRLPNGDDVRLFSSTFSHIGTGLSTSTNRWDFRATTHVWSSIRTADLGVMAYSPGNAQLSLQGNNPILNFTDLTVPSNSIYLQASGKTLVFTGGGGLFQSKAEDNTHLKVYESGASGQAAFSFKNNHNEFVWKYAGSTFSGRNLDSCLYLYDNNNDKTVAVFTPTRNFILGTNNTSISDKATPLQVFGGKGIYVEGRTTANRNGSLYAGLLGYNTDSAKYEYYNGSAWVTINGTTGGLPSQSLQQTLDVGKTLNKADTLKQAGFKFNFQGAETIFDSLRTTTHFELKNNSGSYIKSMPSTDRILMVAANASIDLGTGPGEGIDFSMNNTGNMRFFTSSGQAMTFKQNGRLLIGTTSDAGSYTLQNTGGLYQQGSFRLGGTRAATSNDVKLLVKGESDSTVAQLDFPIVQTSYTPTRTDVTNIGTASVTTSYYQRTGNKIEVWGEVTIDPTATGDTQITLSLPIASSITNSYDLSGSAVTYDNNQTFRIYFGGGNAIVRGNASVDASSHTYSYRYVYYYIAP